MKRLVHLAIGLLAIAAGLLPLSGSAAPAYPNSMASTGDSITRAFDMSIWHVYNDAKTGANMPALDGQLATAAGPGVQYVTVLIGANDLCTSTIAGMTRTATFESEFNTALTDFFARDPSAIVSVSSLPNIYQLWSVLRTNSSAENAWKHLQHLPEHAEHQQHGGDAPASRCPGTGRQSGVGSRLCRFAGCHWENLTGYKFAFEAADISGTDYVSPEHGRPERHCGGDLGRRTLPERAPVPSR